MFRPFSFLVERLSDASDRVARAIEGRGKGVRWLVRIAGLSIAALAVTQLIPTLADEATPPPNQVNTSLAPSESDSVVVLGDNVEGLGSGADNSTVTPGDTAVVSYATSETETVVNKPRVRASQVQSTSIKVPSAIKVDPRAVTALLPLIDLSGEGTLLACISGVGTRFDGARKGFADDLSDEDLLIEGDLTGSLRISGSSSRILGVVNGEGGLRIWSNSGRVVGKTFNFALVPVSDLTTEAELCDQGNSRQIALETLGISLETKKGGVRLKG